jgi:hypothetical protein
MTNGVERPVVAIIAGIAIVNGVLVARTTSPLRDLARNDACRANPRKAKSLSRGFMELSYGCSME